MEYREYRQKAGLPFFERPIPETPDAWPEVRGLKEAAEIARGCLDGPVTVIGDYDADGVCAASILGWMFRAAGADPVLRLPERSSKEGYGYVPVSEIDGGLVVTVDNGITSAGPVGALKKKGCAVIVIDHHLPRADGELPPADVVIDPRAEPDPPYADYCGAGLAYRFAGELLPGMNLSQLRCLAGIATVADVVPLTGANRRLVIDAIEDIRAGRVVPGLRPLIPALGLDVHLNASDIAFKIGPALNAGGRLFPDGANRALRLLMAGGDNDCLDLMAADVVACNKERKRLTKGAYEYLLNEVYDGSRPVFLWDSYLPEGIVGLLAGKFTERYECPSLVFTEPEPGLLKGSGRSVPGVNLKEVLDECSNLLVSYGGHAGAAGLSLRASDYDAFVEAFRKAAGEMPALEDVVYYDDVIEPGRVREKLAAMERYAPFGEGNPEPLFRMSFRPEGEFRRTGDGTHFSVKEKDFELVGFGNADEYEAIAGFTAGPIDFVGTLGRDWWHGSSKVTFEVKYMQPATCP